MNSVNQLTIIQGSIKRRSTLISQINRDKSFIVEAYNSYRINIVLYQFIFSDKSV